MVLPSFSRRLAIRTATATAAPQEMPDEDAFLARQPAGVRDRLVVADLFDGVHERQVQDVGHEAGADALDLVRPRLERRAGARLGEDGTGLRLDRHRDDRLAAACA